MTAQQDVDHSVVTSLAVTTVYYSKGDPLGAVLALISLTPIFAVVAYVAVFCSTPSKISRTRILAIILGNTLSLIVNTALKLIFNQSRPNQLNEHVSDGLDSGMPSNHAQFVGFGVGFLLTGLAMHSQSARISNLKASDVHAKGRGLLLLNVAWGLLSALVIFSRVYLNYHTIAQVVVGTMVGVSVGVLWRIQFYRWALPLASWIVERSWLGSILDLVFDGLGLAAAMSTALESPLDGETNGNKKAK